VAALVDQHDITVRESLASAFTGRTPVRQSCAPPSTNVGAFTAASLPARSSGGCTLKTWSGAAGNYGRAPDGRAR
jgi:hypothetical protein